MSIVGGLVHPLAESWYTSGTFWGVAGIVVAVVVGAVGVWAAFRAADPRQLVSWQVRAVVPLLSQSAHHAGELEIRLDGAVLHNPRTIEIQIRNRGKRDIPTSAFDQARPLRVDIGTPIVKVLRTESAPEGFRPLRLTVDGTAVALGPDLFKKGQVMMISLLVDGPRPHVTLPEPPFIDVSVREDRDGDAGQPSSTAMATVAVVTGATVAAGTAAAKTAGATTSVAVWAGFAGFAGAFLAGAAAALRRLRR